MGWGWEAREVLHSRNTASPPQWCPGWAASSQWLSKPRKHNPVEVKWFFTILNNCIWVGICMLYSLFACFTLYLFNELYAQDFLNRLLSILVLNVCFSGERSFISPHLYFIFNFFCISMLCLKLFPLKHNLCSWKVGFLWLSFRIIDFNILPGASVPSIISREASPGGTHLICLRCLL